MKASPTFTIDYDCGIPVWVQLKNRFAYLISSGAYERGERLPTVRALAVELDISYNTVNRAYMSLESDGYISTRKGRGTFVSETFDPVADNGVEEGARAIIDEMLRLCSNMGMDKKDILNAVEMRLEQM